MMNAVLKLMKELVNDRGVRISVDANSKLGNSLFKYVAKNVLAIAKNILHSKEGIKNLNPNEAYKKCWKPVSLIIQVATNSVASRLVNFQ